MLHVVRTFGSGGMERNLRRVAIDGVRRGQRHSVLLLHDMTDVLELPREVPLVRAVAASRDPRMPLLVAQRILALAPTVIHVRNFGPWLDTALARLVVAPHVPLVFSFHGVEARSFARAQRLRWRALARATTRVFAVSDAARRVLVDGLHLSADTVGVLSNGVDVERFCPRTGPRAPGPLVVGAVGRLFAIKNHAILVRAVHALAREGLDVELRVAGDGPERARLEALARDLGARVVFAGAVTDVPSFLRALDVFVLSSDDEASPNALLEAMATGLACVSTDVGGAREVLDHGRAGALVPVRDVAALARAIAALARDEARAQALGALARAHAVARYAEARMFDAYAALYEDPRRAPLDA